MMEFLLYDHPWLLVVLYAIESAVSQYASYHISAIYNHVRCNSRAKTDESDLFVQRVNVEVHVHILPVVIGVSLLLLCAYWDIVHHVVFLLLIGISVVMSAFNLLLYTLPSLFYWRIHRVSFKTINY